MIDLVFQTIFAFNDKQWLARASSHYQKFKGNPPDRFALVSRVTKALMRDYRNILTEYINSKDFKEFPEGFQISGSDVKHSLKSVMSFFAGEAVRAHGMLEPTSNENKLPVNIGADSFYTILRYDAVIPAREANSYYNELKYNGLSDKQLKNRITTKLIKYMTHVMAGNVRDPWFDFHTFYYKDKTYLFSQLMDYFAEQAVE